MPPHTATQQQIADQICQLASSIHDIESRIATAANAVSRANNRREEAEQELLAMQHKLASLIAALGLGNGFARVLVDTLKEWNSGN